MSKLKNANFLYENERGLPANKLNFEHKKDYIDQDLERYPSPEL